MGFFDKLFGKKSAEAENKKEDYEIILSEKSRIVSDTEYGDGDRKFIISFRLNDSFKETKSSAAEVQMLYAYAHDNEAFKEGDCLYIAIQTDDEVYSAVEEFKEKGSFTGGEDIVPLSGKFYFKAKTEYYDSIMYFYGIDRCDGFWENNGLCMVYPKGMAGTEAEKKLMKVLDEAAESYCEEEQ